MEFISYIKKLIFRKINFLVYKDLLMQDLYFGFESIYVTT